jgi:hypothetical protein
MATMRDLDQLCLAMPETEKHEDNEGHPSWPGRGQDVLLPSLAAPRRGRPDDR